MKNTNKLYIMLAIVLVAVVVLGVAYAAMSTVLTINAGKVTQNALSWNVAFDTASTTVNAGYKAAATFADEFMSNCNKDTFKNYEPAQRVVKNFKALFNKDGKGKAISSRSL